MGSDYFHVTVYDSNQRQRWKSWQNGGGKMKGHEMDLMR
jgi:hypothetical protein